MKAQRCVCGAATEKIKTRLKLFDGDITIEGVDAFYCPKCKEEILSSDQVEAAQKKYEKILPDFDAYSMRKKVTKVGNSLTIPISRELADYMHLTKGEEVQITVKNKKRIIIDVA
ncbi:MAG: YgiT-type zinc finger protein [Candidatus Altiarchaeota archaeon]